MSALAWTAVIVVPILVSIVVGVAVGRALSIHSRIPTVLEGSPRVCYRCGGEADVEYMALHYCWMCREVIVRMLPIVGLGGMPGFPGASGYLEFPKLGPIEEKKEA